MSAQPHDQPIDGQTLDRRIPLVSAPNMRDLGGLPAGRGVVRRGQVFRSASVGRLSGEDRQALADLGIATVYDLRTARERTREPDRLPASAREVPLDVLADDQDDTTTGLVIMSGDARRVADLLGDGRAEAIMEQSYRKFVRLDSAKNAYRAFFHGLADGSRDGGALFHCATGKDRTGWAAAVLLRLLGAGEDAVRADYLQTNTDLLPALQPVLDRAEADGVAPGLLLPILGVRQSYLDAADEEVEALFGSFDAYIGQGLGLDDAVIGALRTRFVA